jgi:hypothetical protein
MNIDIEFCKNYPINIICCFKESLLRNKKNGDFYFLYVILLLKKHQSIIKGLEILRIYLYESITITIRAIFMYLYWH